MSFVDSILAVVIPLGFVLFILWMLDRKLGWYSYFSRYIKKIFSWMKSGAR